jgi:hypothetical protein
VGGMDGRLLKELASPLVRPVRSLLSAECRCAVAKARHERAAKEGAEVVKRRQEFNNWKRRYVSTMSAMGGRWAAVGNNCLTNFW